MNETPNGPAHGGTPEAAAVSSGNGGSAALSAKADEEQLLYAKILARGMYLGLALLLGTFALYATGLVSPAVPIEALPDYWTLTVHEYLEVVNEHHLHRDHLITGWSWLRVVGFGDYMNLIGIALLSAVTIVCYVGILPGLLRKKDWVFAAVAATEVLILVLAASGIVRAGH